MITQYSRGGSPSRRRAGPRVRRLAELPRQAPESIKLAVRNGVPLGLPLHLRRRRGDRPARVEHKESIFLSPAVGIMCGQRARGRGVRHRPPRWRRRWARSKALRGDDRAVPRAAQARAPGAAGRRLRLPEQPDRAQRQGPRAVRQALRLLAGRGAARGHAVRRPGDGPGAARAARRRATSPTCSWCAASPPRTSACCRTRRTCSHIMQNGVFYKRADQLTAA